MNDLCARVAADLPALATRELSSGRSAELQSHLADCGSCRAELASLAAFEASLASAFSAAPVLVRADLAAAVRARILAAHAPDSSSVAAILRKLVAPAFAAVRPGFAWAGAAAIALAVAAPFLADRIAPSTSKAGNPRARSASRGPAATQGRLRTPVAVPSTVTEGLSDPSVALAAYGAGLVDPSDLARAVWPDVAAGSAFESDGEFGARVAREELSDDEYEAVSMLFGTGTSEDENT